MGRGTRKGPGKGEVNCGSQMVSCSALANTNRRRPGSFVPQCKSDGTFKEKQCHSSSGYCWCVDTRSGKEIRGTKKGPGQGEVNCSDRISLLTQSYMASQSGPCTTRLNSQRAGSYVPQCMPDGTFTKKQCHSSTGYCWCVDTQSGKEIKGTKKGPGRDVNCGLRSGPCTTKMNSRMTGSYVPQCKFDGTFKEKQCHSSTGHC